MNPATIIVTLEAVFQALVQLAPTIVSLIKTVVALFAAVHTSASAVSEAPAA